MKKLLFLFSFLFSLTTYSQVNGNEWINYDQSYYRIKVYQTGIHKLTYETLANSGVNLSGISPAQFQIFGKEKQIPIFIQGDQDNSFDPGDYILFYAEKNDGWLDSLLYKDSNGIGNPAYSLYSDTISYFFSWNQTGNNLRFQWTDDQDFGNISTTTSYMLSKSVVSFNNAYYDLKADDGYNSSSFFKNGEGWGAGATNGVNGVTLTYNLSTPKPYTAVGGPATKFVGLSVSNSNATNTADFNGPNHNFTWLLGTSQLQIYQESFKSYQQKRVALDIPTGFLSDGTTPIRYKIAASSDYATDYQAVSYISLLYPRLTDLNNVASGFFWIPKNSSDTRGKVVLTNAPLQNEGRVFTFGNQPRIIPVHYVSNNSYQFILPNSTDANQPVFISDSSSYLSVTAVQPVSTDAHFVHYTVDPNDDNVVLMVYNKALKSSATNYANYRKSSAGGNHTVILADIDQLSDQYGGGIEKHILGIRRFVQDIANHSNFVPRALYLLGKGIREANESLGNSYGARKSAYAAQMNLVPSFGYPSSDNAITAGLGTTDWEPLVPTGRIPALTNQQLDEYIDKVKQYDEYNDPNIIPYTSQARDWQKHIIHFSGGSTTSEQSEFSYYLNGMKQIIEDTLYGGTVETVHKQNSLPLDPVVVSSVTQRISDGASILNFFGHASADGFEINIDDPANWNNDGKYPLVIGNACYSGDMYHASTSVSEKFVLVPHEGAIAFMSTVKTGYSFSLNNYTSELYRQMSYKNYGQPLGYLIQQTIKTVQATFTNNAYDEATCEQMSLDGDPLLIINTHPKSEIDINDQSLYFTPDNIDMSVDSITANLILTNIGKSVTDTFSVDITRKFPSGVDSVYHLFWPKLNYKDTLKFKMPLDGVTAAGLNQFSVDVDLPSQIDEYENITNNQLHKNLFVNIAGILPVYPYNFAVVPKDTVTVKASTINPLAPMRTYRFEIDTTDQYNSPEHRVAIVAGLGGVKEVKYNEWKSPLGISKPLICTDSTVYFWRVAIDSSTLDWHEFSFQYIPTKIGWGQAQFYQFKNNNFYSVDYDRPDRKRIFDTVPQTLGVRLINKPSSAEEYNGNYGAVNGQAVEYGVCTTAPSFYVYVFDPITLKPWQKNWNGLNPDHDFGNANNGSACRNRLESYFIFRMGSTQQLVNFQNMLAQIPNGYYVIITSGIRCDTTLWNTTTPSIFQMFTDLGCTQVQQSNDRTFAVIYQKGNPSFLNERLSSTTPHEELEFSVPVLTSQTNGAEVSPLIGPARNWGAVYWRHSPEEVPSTDSCILKINYFDSTAHIVGTHQYLMSVLDSIINLNAQINAHQYPYIQLSATYYDSTHLTPAQLRRWHVLYQPVPEAAIDGSNGYTWMPARDTLEQGEPLKFAADVKNISDYPMDSLLIHYWIEEVNRNKDFIPYPRQDSLRVLQTLRDTVSIPTENVTGDNILWMEVNPYINGKLDQLEQYHFNNLLSIPFHVNGDKINPILDVTFDGIHILNEDIVSPKAQIQISLKDENPYLIMDEMADTSRFGVYLIDPHGVQHRIPFIDGQGHTILQVTLATAQNKRFKILYDGDFKEDGMYTLLVQGADKSNNLSGNIEYRIKFQVINESTITNMMNYPNPFSTSTRFVFTLTGSEVPDDILIQIMTITGRVVREITEDELGPIRIGRNITQYAWDGKDEFGDQLANGVYLYRVTTRLNGDEIKHRDSGADKYFKKSFGKMYLLR